MIKVSHQKKEITYFLSQNINFNFIEERCQYWFNKTDGRITSPNFGDNDLGYPQWYDYNINCTWILNADQGFYITLEIVYFGVNDITNDIYFLNLSITKVQHSSLEKVIIWKSMMDQIYNHH